MTDDAHEYELVIAQRFVKDMRRLSGDDIGPADRFGKPVFASKE